MIYLDYNSTTPIEPSVADFVYDISRKEFGNPSSTHGKGIDAKHLVYDARDVIAQFLGVNNDDVIFTSGATEANTLAVASFALDDGFDCIAYGKTEHKSVINACKMYSDKINVTSLGVKKDGTLNLEFLKSFMEMTPIDVISVMFVNGETGVINPLKKIAKIAHKAGAFVHSDITQALGKIPIDLIDLQIDAASCSAHKMYGPKGVGAFIAPYHTRKRLTPLVPGAGQESGHRGGTENVPGIMGFAKACQIAHKALPVESKRIMMIRDNFEAKIQFTIPGVSINGKDAPRVSNTSNFRIEGVQADSIVSKLRDIEISAGSACSPQTSKPSHVLTAMGLGKKAASESLGISFGRFSTMSDVETAVADIARAAELVRGTESN